ncbi:3-phosphoshikimate 1-carboxyvinyltransferase [Desulfurispira natronophila]|uniref:3-phosphoshikimate 1-carboxyvinyltransferase n=1 Tax=Desulfurispira natronophila TaxID=682562 RepID=A0A7W7Y454_9BACT|nr:3-phosphoshikimate 1-carboxyvinyltransferase [Desulfurispira natronophila]MBB5021725.1 3-phosphoshikimate 1-carboxyvinyltransferase [Desulfurispira natronophila]
MLNGSVDIAPDKSITHRAIMFSSLARGTSHIVNPLLGEDNISTCQAFEAMGVEITREERKLIINSPGFEQLQEASDVLDFGNSGTTTRLMLGILSGLPLFSIITGDRYLRQRPMLRVIEPLRRMGARIDARSGGKLLPAAVRGGALNGIDHRSQVASAQVKSAILLAGLFANGTTTVQEPELSRDHTERMLPFYGVKVQREDRWTSVQGGAQLHPVDMTVPGDISSAAFFLVAACVTPGSAVTICNVGVNPTRTGIIDVLQQMGAKLELRNQRTVCGEPVADIEVCHSSLSAVDIYGSTIPRLIDEIPALAVAMAFAEGKSTVKDGSELRVKETDRIATTLANLKALGVEYSEYEDGFAITGDPERKLPAGAVLDSYGDHRIGMSAWLFRLLQPTIEVEGMECVAVSFPGFQQKLQSLQSNGALS